jgi:hypothetical protein
MESPWQELYIDLRIRLLENSLNNLLMAKNSWLLPLFKKEKKYHNFQKVFLTKKLEWGHIAYLSR